MSGFLIRKSGSRCQFSCLHPVVMDDKTISISKSFQFPYL